MDCSALIKVGGAASAPGRDAHIFGKCAVSPICKEYLMAILMVIEVWESPLRISSRLAASRFPWLPWLSTILPLEQSDSREPSFPPA